MSFVETVAVNYRNGQPDERDGLFQWMLRYFDSVVDTAGFATHIDVDSLSCLISSAANQGSPRKRLEAVIRWLLLDLAGRIVFAGRLLACIPGALVLDDVTLIAPVIAAQCTIPRDGMTAMEDMKREHVPYYVTGEGVALGLGDASEGGSKVFRFVFGCAEFVARVEWAKGMECVDVLLKCMQVTVAEGVELPVDVSGKITMRLCCEDEDGRMEEVERGGFVEEDGISLVKNALSQKWEKTFHVGAWVAGRSQGKYELLSLYVQVREITVNGNRNVYSVSEDRGQSSRCENRQRLRVRFDESSFHPEDRRGIVSAQCSCMPGREQRTIIRRSSGGKRRRSLDCHRRCH